MREIGGDEDHEAWKEEGENQEQKKGLVGVGRVSLKIGIRKHCPILWPKVCICTIPFVRPELRQEQRK